MVAECSGHSGLVAAQRTSVVILPPEVLIWTRKSAPIYVTDARNPLRLRAAVYSF